MEQQERFLKLKTEIARAEAKEKAFDDFNVIEEDEPLQNQPSDRAQIITPSLCAISQGDLKVMNEKQLPEQQHEQNRIFVPSCRVRSPV